MKKRLLVVEDEAFIRELIKDFFFKDFVVRAVARGDEGLQIFLEETPDAVILDVELEGTLRGDHLLKVMKLLKKEIPVVMISGRGDLKESLIAAGASAFFDKPFNIQQIREFFIAKEVLLETSRAL